MKQSVVLSIALLALVSVAVSVVSQPTPAPGDFASNEDFARILARLRVEAENDLTLNKANYMSDDADVEDIMRQFETTTSSNCPGEETDDEASEGEDCPICLNEYKPDQEAMTLQCQHQFHADCIVEWKQKGFNRCPICRSTIT